MTTPAAVLPKLPGAFAHVRFYYGWVVFYVLARVVTLLALAAWCVKLPRAELIVAPTRFTP